MPFGQEKLSTWCGDPAGTHQRAAAAACHGSKRLAGDSDHARWRPRGSGADALTPPAPSRQEIDLPIIR